MLTVILLFVSLASVIAWWVITNKDEPPAYPGYLPLIGHAHLLLGDSIKLYNLVKSISYKSLEIGGPLSASLGPTRVYFVTDPEDFLKIANTFFEKDRFLKFSKNWLGDGLITSDAPLWKVHRKILNPAFNSAILDGFMDLFNSQSRRLVKAMEVEVGRGPFDHWDYCRSNALETICSAALGIDLRDKKEINNITIDMYFNAIDGLLNVIISRIQKIWLHTDFIYGWTKLKTKEDKLLKTVHNISEFALKKKKAELLNCSIEEYDKKPKGPIFKPFLDHFLKQATENGTFTDKVIRDHIDSIIVAGYETLATAVTYTILLVGSYPHIQDKLFKELRNVFGDDDRDVTKQDLSKLVYLEALLKETLRLYPVAPVVVRQLDRDIKLRNCTLAKGRPCFLSIYGVHRHPMWGPDVEEFKPERWLDSATLPDIPNLFAGFSLGRRNCIGKTYAIMSIKVILAHFFRCYKVNGDHTKMVTKLDVLLKPASGHYVAIEKRIK